MTTEANKNEQIQVSVTRSDLIFLRRVIDTALSEVHAAAVDIDFDESIIIDLDESLSIVTDYLGK